MTSRSNAATLCFILSEYQFNFANGEWLYIGEYNNKPSYRKDDYYLEWINEWERNALHASPQGSTSIYGYCDKNDIIDCIAGTWYYVNNNKFSPDSNAAIAPCPTTKPPTNNPTTDAPSKSPTTTAEPTTSPLEPTNYPTLSPLQSVTANPTTTPLKVSTANPTTITSEPSNTSTMSPNQPTTAPDSSRTNAPSKTPTNNKDAQFIEPTATPTQPPSINIAAGNNNDIAPGGFGIVDVIIILLCLCCVIICCYVGCKKKKLKLIRKGAATFDTKCKGEIQMQPINHTSSPIPLITNNNNNNTIDIATNTTLVNVTIVDDSSCDSNAPPPPPPTQSMMNRSNFNGARHRKQESEDSLDKLQHRFLSDQMNENENGNGRTAGGPPMSFDTDMIRNTLPLSPETQPEQTPPPPPLPIVEGNEDSDDSLYQKQHEFLQDEVNRKEDQQEEENNLKVVRAMTDENTPQTPGGDIHDNY